MILKMFEEYKHHLEEDYSLVINKSTYAAGRCYKSKKTIELSSRLAEIRGEEATRITLLHEIAHARCDMNVHHGNEWKKEFRRLLDSENFNHISTQRCFELSINESLKLYKYALVTVDYNNKIDNFINGYMRRPSTDLSNRYYRIDGVNKADCRYINTCDFEIGKNINDIENWIK